MNKGGPAKVAIKEQVGLFTMALYQTLMLRSGEDTNPSTKIAARIKNIIGFLYPLTSPSSRGLYVEFTGTTFRIFYKDETHIGDMTAKPSAAQVGEYKAYCRFIQDVNTVRVLKTLFPEFSELTMQGIPHARQRLYIDCSLLDDRGLPGQYQSDRQKLMMRLSNEDYRTDSCIKTADGFELLSGLMDNYLAVMEVSLSPRTPRSLVTLIGEEDE